MAYITDTTGEKHVIESKTIPIKTYWDQGLDFFLKFSYIGWSVNETETGCRVIDYLSTPEEAEQALHELIDKIGVDRFISKREEMKAKIGKLKKR